MKELYSVATGAVNPLMKRSRAAVKLMKKQKGFYALHVAPDGRVLWLYDSENHAKAARNIASAEGVQCGINIVRFMYDEETNVLIFADEEKANLYIKPLNNPDEKKGGAE